MGKKMGNCQGHFNLDYHVMQESCLGEKSLEKMVNLYII